MVTEDRAPAPIATDLPDVRAYAPNSGPMPRFVEPHGSAITDMGRTLGWFTENRDEIDRLTTEVGALVLRGFPIHTSTQFSQLVDSYPCPTFGYSAGATPRKNIEGRAYEATRAPAQHKLKLHQEMAYLPTYPSRLAFYCMSAPASGGETIIGDMRRFDRTVDQAFRARLKERGVLYTRNFRSPEWTSGNEVLDAYHRPWTEAFVTDDPAKVEADCEAMGLGYEWVVDGINVIYRAPGFVAHPDTGAEIWFNQIPTQSLVPENVGRERLEAYRASYGDHPLPYDTRYGDGSPIDPADASALHPLLDDVTVGFPWQHGDVMFVDNFCTAHGRNAYTGTRDVQVALLG